MVLGRATNRQFAFRQIQEVFPEPGKHARDVKQGTRGRKSNKVMLTGVLREN